MNNQHAAILRQMAEGRKENAAIMRRFGNKEYEAELANEAATLIAGAEALEAAERLKSALSAALARLEENDG